MSQSPSTLKVPSSELLKTPRQKHKRGAVFTVNEKNMVINIYKYFQEAASKNPNQPVYKTDLADKTAHILGIGIASVYRIVKEYKKEGKPSAPNLTRKRVKITEKMDDLTKCAIKEKVHSFFLKGELPSLNKVLKAVNEDEALPNLKRTTLYSLLKELKSNYIKKQRKSALIDKDDMHLWQKKISNDEAEDQTGRSDDEATGSSFVQRPEIPTTSKATGYNCNACGEAICGFRYLCVECAEYNICLNCEALNEHPTHYMLRIPEGKPQAETKVVIEKIRKEIRITAFNREEETQQRLAERVLKREPIQDGSSDNENAETLIIIKQEDIKQEDPLDTDASTAMEQDSVPGPVTLPAKPTLDTQTVPKRKRAKKQPDPKNTLSQALQMSGMVEFEAEPMEPTTPLDKRIKLELEIDDTPEYESATIFSHRKPNRQEQSTSALSDASLPQFSGSDIKLKLSNLDMSSIERDKKK